MTRAPCHSFSICARVAGMLPPGSPATMIAAIFEVCEVELFLGGHFGQAHGVGGRAAEDGGAGIQDRAQRARGCSGRRREWQRQPMRVAASKAVQNPRNGPKENAKKM